jgi:serine/threonine protein kinase
MFNLIGKMLGPYRILEQIGMGGMATVYKAYQPSMDRFVAIKVLPPHFSQDEQFIKRFQREAHAIAKLEHAHILPSFDYGECEGVTYIAMRYIQAGTLKELLSKGPLPLDEIARIVGQISSALHPS